MFLAPNTGGACQGKNDRNCWRVPSKDIKNEVGVQSGFNGKEVKEVVQPVGEEVEVGVGGFSDAEDMEKRALQYFDY